MRFLYRGKQILAGAAIASGAILLSSGADSGTVTSTFHVNATISNSCTVTNTGDINLTEVTTSGTNTVSITCNSATGWNAVFGGANDALGKATLPYHYMKDNGTNLIEYILTGTSSTWTFSDGTHRLANDGANPPTSFFASGTGDGTAQAATITATATTTGGTANYSITTAPQGNYADTVTVTVYF